MGEFFFSGMGQGYVRNEAWPRSEAQSFRYFVLHLHIVAQSFNQSFFIDQSAFTFCFPTHTSQKLVKSKWPTLKNTKSKIILKLQANKSNSHK